MYKQMGSMLHLSVCLGPVDNNTFYKIKAIPVKHQVTKRMPWWQKRFVFIANVTPWSSLLSILLIFKWSNIQFNIYSNLKVWAAQAGPGY